MKYLFGGILLGLTLGLLITNTGLNPSNSKVEQTDKRDNTATPPIPKWRIASFFGNWNSPTGKSAQIVSQKIRDFTKNSINATNFEPRSPFPPFEMFEAVSSRKIEAAITNPVYWGKYSRSFELIGGFPFGPDPNTFLAWYSTSRGKNLFEKVYQRHNLYGLVCGITGPKFGSWFRIPVKKISDLKNRLVASVGLGRLVLIRAGAKSIVLPPDQIFSAISAGKIFGATIFEPLEENQIPSRLVQGHAYFPGWQQQYSITDLIVNIKDWNGLTQLQKKDIITACSISTFESLSASEGSQFDNLKLLINNGVKVDRWSPNLINKFKLLWEKELANVANTDAEFKLLLNSIRSFQQNYSTWVELGYL